LSGQEENDLTDFLEIVNVVKIYGWYVLRKAIGTLYVVISAAIGIILSFFLVLREILNPPLLEIMLCIVTVIGVATIIFFAVQIFSSLKIYPIKIRRVRFTRITSFHIWLLMLLVTSFIALSCKFLGLSATIFALSIHYSVAIGNAGNYFTSHYTENYPGKIEREYLYISIIGFLTGPFILLYPDLKWLIVTLVNLVGSYLFGIFIIISSGKLLSEL